MDVLADRYIVRGCVYMNLSLMLVAGDTLVSSGATNAYLTDLDGNFVTDFDGHLVSLW